MSNGHPVMPVAAADAILLVEIDNAVRVLNDRTRRGTGLETAGVLAVHAGRLFGSSTQDALRIFVLREAIRVTNARSSRADCRSDRCKCRCHRADRSTPCRRPATLQPMHLVVSISFATWPVCAPRTSGEERSSRAADDVQRLQRHLKSPMPSRPSPERLEFRRLRVRVTDRGSQRVGEKSGHSNTHESPMERHADGVQDLPVDGQGPDTFGSPSPPL